MDISVNIFMDQYPLQAWRYGLWGLLPTLHTMHWPTPALREAHTAVLVLSEILRFYVPQRPHAAPMGWYFHQISPNINRLHGTGIRPKKLKILTKFYQFSPYRLLNASHWPIPYTTFTKFSEFVGSFVLDHVLKFGEIRSRGSRAKGF